MAKFKIGDRVKVDSDYTAFKKIAGKEGTVCRVEGTTIGIRFDESFDGGHDCSGTCTHGHGRNVSEGFLCLVSTAATGTQETVPNGKKKKIVKQPSYKAGDIVKIREDIVDGRGGYKHHTGGSNSVTWDMFPFKGTEHRVIDDEHSGYHLEGATQLQWTDEMIEGKVEICNLEVGDKVRAIQDFEGKRTKGKEGVICRVSISDNVGVKFDDNIGGHDCAGTCTYGYGWNIPPKYLEFVQEGSKAEAVKATPVEVTQFKVGDKVTILSKTVPGYTASEGSIKKQNDAKLKGQEFCYVTKIYTKEQPGSFRGDHRIEFPVYAVNLTLNDSGDYFYGKDLALYVEPTKSDLATKEVAKGIKLVESIEEKKEPKFKVGDKVAVLSKSVPGFSTAKTPSEVPMWKSAKDNGQNYLYVNTVYTENDRLPHFSKYKDVKFPIYAVNRVKNSGGDFFYEEDLALYVEEAKIETKADQPKFKVGDFVRGTKASDNKYGYTNSDMTKGKVVSVAKSGQLITVQMIEHKRGDTGTFEVDPKYFELVDTSAPSVELPATRDYKVGDRVVVGTCEGNRAIEGKIGTIRRIDMYSGAMLYTLEFEAPMMGHTCKFGDKAFVPNGRGWNVRRSEIKGLADEKKPVKLTESAQKAEIKPEVKKEGVKPMPKYNVGDKVKLQCSWVPRYDYGSVKQGDEGVIVSVHDANGRGNQVAYKVDFPAQSFWTGCEDELVPVAKTAKSGIKLVATETVVPGISFKTPAIEVVDYEYDFEEEEIYDEEYEEENYEGEFHEVVLTPYEPCTLGATPIDLESLTRRDTMAEGITLREAGAVIGSSPARGIFPTTSKIERKTGGIMKAFGNIFGSNIGKDNSGRLALTIAGIAVKNNEGKFVAYKDGALVDVMDAKFDVDNAFYRIPTTDVKKDDIIINQSGVPVIVVKQEADGITVINPYNGLQEKIVPSTNLLGMKFYVKVISLFGDMFKGIDLSKPESVLPFVLMGEGGDMGEMLPLMMMMGGNKDMNSMLPLLMLSGKGGDMGDMLPFLLMGQNGGDMSAILPLMLLGKGGKGDMMETMLMMQAFGGKGFNLFGAPAAAPADAE